MKIAVLDFEKAEVHIYKNEQSAFFEDSDDNVEDFLENKGHKLSNCQWMTSENDELDIVIH